MGSNELAELYGALFARIPVELTEDALCASTATRAAMQSHEKSLFSLPAQGRGR